VTTGGTVLHGSRESPALELFFTEVASLRRALLVDGGPLLVDGNPYSIPGDATQALKDAAAPDGMPFVLDDDGHYEATVNRFFRDLPAMGCRSVNTWQAYARDLVTFARFLDERCGGKKLLDAALDDVRLYYRTRRMTGVHSVDPTTWNRSIAALDKFFQWAVEQKLIAAVPFTYKTVTRHLPGMEAPQIQRQGKTCMNPWTASHRGPFGVQCGSAKKVTAADATLIRRPSRRRRVRAVGPKMQDNATNGRTPWGADLHH
jgi:hypothetical protein